MTAHKTGWIKIWVAIGALVFIGTVLVPIGLMYHLLGEINRYEGCAAGTRDDCHSSIVWALYEQALTDESAAGLRVQDAAAEYRALLGESNGEGSKLEDRPRTLVQTSEKAALIVKAELQDMALSGGWYRAEAGTKIQVTATIEGNPDKVELYLSDKNPTEDGISRKVGEMKKGADSEYTGSFTVTAGLLGELEIRAIGPGKESASLFLNVAAE